MIRSCSSPSDPTDVTVALSLRAAFVHSIKCYGRPPDLVFANAGVSAHDDFEEDDETGMSSLLLTVDQ